MLAWSRLEGRGQPAAANANDLSESCALAAVRCPCWISLLATCGQHMLTGPTKSFSCCAPACSDGELKEGETVCILGGTAQLGNWQLQVCARAGGCAWPGGLPMAGCSWPLRPRLQLLARSLGWHAVLSLFEGGQLQLGVAALACSGRRRCCLPSRRLLPAHGSQARRGVPFPANCLQEVLAMSPLTSSCWEAEVSVQPRGRSGQATGGVRRPARDSPSARGRAV